MEATEEPIRREMTTTGPYRCTNGHYEHVLNMLDVREEDSYDPNTDRWVETFYGTGYIDPPLPTHWEPSYDTLEIWHIDRPDLVVYATYAKMEVNRDGSTRYRLYGSGSLMRLGPLRHTKEHDDE